MHRGLTEVLRMECPIAPGSTRVARKPGIEGATRLHDANDHCRFRVACQPGFNVSRQRTRFPVRRAEVYGSEKRRSSTMQMTAAFSAGIQQECNKTRRTEIYGSGSNAAPQCRQPLQFPRGMPARMRRVKANALGLTGISGVQR